MFRESYPRPEALDGLPFFLVQSLIRCSLLLYVADGPVYPCVTSNWIGSTSQVILQISFQGTRIALCDSRGGKAST